MSDNVVPFRGGLSRAAAERLIREFAADTAAWDFSWSLAKQTAAAGITMAQVIGTIREGAVVENAVRNEQGDWICVLRGRKAGRTTEVVVALSPDRGLTVVAVR